MTQESGSNSENTEYTYDAIFEFEDRAPVECVFEINPAISDLNYAHYQNVASDSWTITHNLGKYPSLTIVDSAGTVVMPNEIVYTNKNVLVVSFIGAFAGIAYLN